MTHGTHSGQDHATRGTRGAETTDQSKWWGESPYQVYSRSHLGSHVQDFPGNTSEPSVEFVIDDSFPEGFGVYRNNQWFPEEPDDSATNGDDWMPHAHPAQLGLNPVRPDLRPARLGDDDPFDAIDRVDYGWGFHIVTV